MTVQKQYVFPQPNRKMEFTGERYVSGLTGNIQHEHYHRYLFAAEFCRGKRVLDIACGEGYGCDLLAQVSDQIVGIDIDVETIAYAESTYGSPKIRFIASDATDIPLPDASVDVVTSFETIEHFENHEAFLAELERVLVPGGLVIISSPNRTVYSEQNHHENPFHFRELDREQFRIALKTRFPNVALLEQRPICGSVLMTEDRNAGIRGFESLDGLTYTDTLGVPSTYYFVAIASTAPLPPIDATLLYNDQHILDLHQKIMSEGARANSESARANSERDRADSEAAKAEAQPDDEATRRLMAKFAAEAENARRHIAELDQAQLRWAEEVASLRMEIDHYSDRVSSMRSSLSWRLTKPFRAIWHPIRKFLRSSAAGVRLCAALRHPTNSKKRKAYRQSRPQVRPEASPSSSSPEPRRLRESERKRRREALKLRLRAMFRYPRNSERRKAYRLAHLRREQERAGLVYVPPVPRVHEYRVPTRIKSMSDPFSPTVSVIVPNYNHARFLAQRIDSILAQTYKPSEIILLDDCSTDESRSVIQDYCERYPGYVTSLLNEQNSGAIFRQWRKGIEATKGEIIWVCESDDFCEPDFLHNLLPHFADRSVNVAFGRIQLADQNGNPQLWLDSYREGAEPGIWETSLTRPARSWFVRGFGVNNVIPNVGGCLFRRQNLPEHIWKEAESYSILGDWFLYCHLAGGGQISWEPSAVSYFRQHPKNTSVSAFEKPKYYVEHRRIMELLRTQWDVPDAIVERFYAQVHDQYTRMKLDTTLGSMDQFIAKDGLLATQRTRPHILMCFLGFHPGGGEFFPIHLANALAAEGYLVSMMALDMTTVEQGMVDLLNPSIPVYSAAQVEQIGIDRFMEEAGVSLIHSHMLAVEWLLINKHRMRADIPYLVSMHGSYEAIGVDDLQLIQILRTVSHFVYTARKNLAVFDGLPIAADVFSQVPNAVQIDRRPFPKTREDLRIPSNAVIFTLVARGIREKGWDVAIDAFRRLRDKSARPLRLLACGEGDEVDYQMAHVASDPDIVFLGYQSCISGLYRMTDCAIVPTRFSGESFPLCIIQALQVGVPVIATRIGEIENMITAPDSDPAGILLDNTDDLEAFTTNLERAMAEMTADDVRADYARTAAQFGERYRMEEVAREYGALYERLIEKHGLPVSLTSSL